MISRMFIGTLSSGETFGHPIWALDYPQIGLFSESIDPNISKTVWSSSNPNWTSIGSAVSAIASNQGNDLNRKDDEEGSRVNVILRVS